jgi:hypothetical protein
VGVVRVVGLGVQVGGRVAEREAALLDSVAGGGERSLEGQLAGHARVGLERVADRVVEALKYRGGGGAREVGLRGLASQTGVEGKQLSKSRGDGRTSH